MSMLLLLTVAFNIFNLCYCHFNILALFTLTTHQNNEFVSNNARLNEQRMRQEHQRLSRQENDVNLLCTMDVGDVPETLYPVLLDIVLSTSNNMMFIKDCVDTKVTGTIDLGKTIILTYIPFELTKLASSILLPHGLDILGLTEAPMYPTYYLDHQLSYFSYQVGFGKEIHKTLLKRLLIKYNITYVAFLNLEEDINGATKQCKNINNDGTSAFCFYSNEYKNGCFKEKHVNVWNKTEVRDSMRLLIKNNFSFVIIAGQAHKIRSFTNILNIELFTGNPFFFNYIDTTIENITSVEDERGYDNRDVLINFPGQFPINEFFHRVYKMTSLLMTSRDLWTMVTANDEIRKFIDQYHWIIKIYIDDYQRGVPMTFENWSKLPQLFRKEIINKFLNRREILIVLIALAKEKTYIDKVSIEDFKQKEYFNPTKALNTTLHCSQMRKNCPLGHELTHAYYTEQEWDYSYGWHCRRCSKGFYKSNKSDIKCQACYKPMITDVKQSFCYDPYTDEYIKLADTSTIIYVSLSSIVLFIILITIIIFMAKRNTPIVLSTNRTMATIQLFSHIVLAVSTVLLFVGTPNRKTCVLRPIVVGVSLCLVISVNLAKTQKLFMIFNKQILVSQGEKFFTNTIEWLLMILTISTDIVIILISFQNADKPPNVDVIYNESDLLKIFHCNNNNILVSQLAFTLILVLCNGMQGFRARHLPSHFKETTHVIYSSFISVMVLAAAATVYFGQHDVYIKEKILMLATGLLNATHFSLIYIYKLYIILCHPHLNTRQAFNEKRKLKMETNFQT